MTDDLMTLIRREVTQWPGVTTGDTGRGGLQFLYGRVELGHLHGSRFADLPFRHFFLQPMDGPDVADHTRRAVEYCLRHPRWRLSVQTHKVLGIR